MAVLSDTDRARINAALMRYLSPRVADYPVEGLTKPDLRAAIDAADSWIDANQAAFVAALPSPFAGASGAPLKVLTFCAVAAMRVGPDFARSIFGEID